MTLEPEVERLRRVYGDYRESPAAAERWSAGNPGNAAIAAERDRTLERMLRERGLVPLAGRRILEVGCGRGDILAGFRRWGARDEDLCGVDLLPDRIELARRSFPGIRFEAANAEQLDLPGESFDLVVLSTVFTSILDDAMARNVAGEVARVLQPGGAIVWYDFRRDNPANRQVRGKERDAIRALFPGFDLDLRPVTLLPPLARRLGRATSRLYPLLAAIPLLRTHYLGLLSRPCQASRTRST